MPARGRQTPSPASRAGRHERTSCGCGTAALRVAHFIAQVCHESAGFRTTQEFGAGSAYEGRKDLGNTQPGDGPRYKGRGLIKLVGRANYAEYGKALSIDLEGNPELASEPIVSLKIACEYWKRRGLNQLADQDDLETITRRINGGLNGLDDRKVYLAKAKAVLGILASSEERRQAEEKRRTEEAARLAEEGRRAEEMRRAAEEAETGVRFEVDGNFEVGGNVVITGGDVVGGDLTFSSPELGGGEAKRFTDVTIYKGHLYASVDLDAQRKLPDYEPLFPKQDYTLEVAIRSKRIGIDADVQAPRAVINPRQDREELKIYVLADAKESLVEIENSLAAIHWPYDGDSESALFRLNVKPLSSSVLQAEEIIEVRLYDACLDLLDIVEITGSVVRSSTRATAAIKPRHLSWPDDAPATPRIETNSSPRLLSIHVSSAEAGFDFEYKFLQTRGEEMSIPIHRYITSDDIQRHLERIRDFWTQLVIGKYEKNLSATKAGYMESLRRLRDLGQDVWLLLFGAATGAEKGAAETLGELLSDMEPQDGAHIQITHQIGLGAFVFPWNVIHPPSKSDEEDVNPYSFWGARYRIEQVREGSKVNNLDTLPIQIIFALDPSFGASEQQSEMFRKYVAAYSERLSVTSPITDWSTLLDHLRKKPSAHLLYFFGHGDAPARATAMRSDSLRLLQDRVNELPDGSAERATWESAIALTQKASEEAWIFIGNSQIRESQLAKVRDYFAGRRPIVFLNMCHSAALAPSITNGLVRVFLDHCATAVIGTEAPMTSVFANAFSEAFFERMLKGSDVLTALWETRRLFLEPSRRNPLGLAFTLYGRGDRVRLGSNPTSVDGQTDPLSDVALEKGEQHG